MYIVPDSIINYNNFNYIQQHRKEFNMSEESKISKAQQKAVAKYMKNNYDTTLIRFKKGAKQLIQTAAKEQNESVNAYIKKAIQTRYTSDTGNNIEL